MQCSNLYSILKLVFHLHGSFSCEISHARILCMLKLGLPWMAQPLLQPWTVVLQFLIVDHGALIWLNYYSEVLD